MAEVTKEVNGADAQDLHSLLSSPVRDFLVRNDGAQLARTIAGVLENCLIDRLLSLMIDTSLKRSIKREPNNCKNRWQKINKIVTKFSGSYAAATRERASGQSDNDVITRAYEIYFNDHATKFNLEYAWRQLRYDQKWCEISTSKTEATSKRRKVEDGSHSAAADDEAQTRPPGVKAAKAKAKKNVEEGKDALELRTIKEIKDKDNAMKATLADKKILDSLIAKKEPLSKTDEALKEKLISMLYYN